MIKEGATAERVKQMFNVLGIKKAEIARQLGITRQAVNYHLTDKTKRHRAEMPVGKRKRDRALALKRYHSKKALEVLE